MGPGVAGGTAGPARELNPEEVVRLERDRVVLLDQRRLPDEEVELECRSAAEVAHAIRTLAIRGAPAIGVAAAYGYALAAARGDDLAEAYRVLAGARPTAVNLAWALAEVRAAGDPAARARELHAEEAARCRRLAEHALPLFAPGTRVLTHCNTGALATGGYGTALGAIRRAWEEGLVASVLVDETRPLLQGARLTAWELERLGIPFTVVPDAAAGALVAAGEVDLAITGADRIAASGDVANKIGTYGVALAATAQDVPFAVAAPSSTIDPATPSGDAIPIEERDAREVSERFPARNPAFDVTPAHLVAAIVTEEGIHRPPYSVSLPQASATAGRA
ncbi:MAG: S-methyl-5-thioribose-1-phosphate isomerase [Thermoleophilia bacterium]|nr:S-methyl-5-thioribose-1-phosphate isomerase [Thermoleophilia bacterium]